jgi:hypothetical protein
MSGSAHGALSSVDAYRAVTKGRRTWLNGCAQIVARAVERGEIPNVHRTTRLIPALIDLLRSSPEEAKAWRGFSGKATAWLALACGGVLLATGETCGRAHNTAGEDDRQQVSRSLYAASAVFGQFSPSREDWEPSGRLALPDPRREVDPLSCTDDFSRSDRRPGCTRGRSWTCARRGHHPRVPRRRCRLERPRYSVRGRPAALRLLELWPPHDGWGRWRGHERIWLRASPSGRRPCSSLDHSTEPTTPD